MTMTMLYDYANLRNSQRLLPNKYNPDKYLQFKLDDNHISTIYYKNNLLSDAIKIEFSDEEKKQMAAYQQQVAEWRATVSMDAFTKVKKMFKKAGVTIYAFKPSALEVSNTDAEIEYALRAAKALGAKSVTVEIPRDPQF